MSGTPASEIGKLLIAAGGISVLVGLLLVFGPRIPLIGRLPGDFVFHRDGLTIAFPFATMLIVSILLTIVLNVVARIFRQ